MFSQQVNSVNMGQLGCRHAQRDQNLQLQGRHGGSVTSLAFDKFFRGASQYDHQMSTATQLIKVRGIFVNILKLKVFARIGGQRKGRRECIVNIGLIE